MLILRRWNKVNKIQMSRWKHKAKVHLIVLNSTWHLLDQSPWRPEPTGSTKGPCSCRLVRCDFELTAIDSNFRVSAESVLIFHHSFIERDQVCQSLSFWWSSSLWVFLYFWKISVLFMEPPVQPAGSLVNSVFFEIRKFWLGFTIDCLVITQPQVNFTLSGCDSN